MMDRADYEELLREAREESSSQSCPYCHGENTDKRYENQYFCYDCEISFTVAQYVMSDDDEIPF